MDSSVRSEPAFNSVKVGVGYRRGRGAHFLLQRIYGTKAKAHSCSKTRHGFELLTVDVVEVGADADGRHFGRPFAVGETAVDLLAVEAAQRVAVLAVVASDRAALVGLGALGRLGKG